MSAVQIRLPCSARAPAEARLGLLRSLGSWGSQESRDTAALLVSELVTNAVQHTGGAPWLTVLLGDGRLRCSVHDTEPAAMPEPSTALVGGDGEGGRGLQLVDALAVDWGVEHEPTGKSVWFELCD